MQKLFNKILVSRYKEVFDNHEEEYSPADWNKLKAKIGKKKTGFIIFLPYLAKAASVILFLGLSVFTVNEFDENKKTENSYKPTHVTELKLNTLEPDSISKEAYSSVNKQFSVAYVANERDTNKTILEETLYQIKTDDIAVNKVELEFNDSSNVILANTKEELEKHRKEIQAMDSASQKTKTMPLLNDEAEFAIIEDTGNGKKRFDFGVGLASVSSYAIEGSSNEVNIGGGFSAAYRISKKLSISTGVIIAKQSMSYDGGVANSGIQNDNSAMNAYNEYVLADPNTNATIDQNSSESTVEFVGIDIPLNVQFKHKKWIITTGVSSLLYVQERYSNSFNAVVSNTVYNKETAKNETLNTVENINSNEKSKLFDRFDFARLLNVSIGYDIPLAKGGLVLEPYVKVPLGYISSKELRMGSGGLALRYNF